MCPTVRLSLKCPDPPVEMPDLTVEIVADVGIKAETWAADLAA